MSEETDLDLAFRLADQLVADVEPTLKPLIQQMIDDDVPPKVAVTAVTLFGATFAASLLGMLQLSDDELDASARTMADMLAERIAEIYRYTAEHHEKQRANYAAERDGA